MTGNIILYDVNAKHNRAAYGLSRFFMRPRLTLAAGEMGQAHPLQQRPESRIAADGIELDGGGDQDQGAVALLEGAFQLLEEARP